MSLDQSLIKDIFEWDTYNWSKAIPLWEKHIVGSELKCLEIGAHQGGPSLWLALQGHSVICTDLNSPEQKARDLHSKYPNTKIVYDEMDATNIPFENEFDIIIFKSVLGGISRDGRDEMKQKVIDEILKALKPKGKLLFAENLEASGLHKLARSKTRKWGNSWNYLKYSDLDHLMRSFSKTDHKTTGFFSAFGPNETIKKILGMVDTIFSWLIPSSKKYIVFGVVEK